ncbi:hypothetical protein, partial [Streptomyces noursei]
MTLPEDRQLVLWGRCQSGRRWFWADSWHDDQDHHHPDHGWTDTEPEALRAGELAAHQITADIPAALVLRHGVAASALRSLNQAKRRAKPAAAGRSAEQVEYL